MPFNDTEKVYISTLRVACEEKYSVQIFIANLLAIWNGLNRPKFGIIVILDAAAEPFRILLT